jgi:ribokinase
MPGFDVIVCGSLHLDVMLYAPALPRPDETVAGRRWERKCGGKGGNQAAMAARAGARTAMIGRVGADDFGAELVAHLDAAGVDRREVGVDPQTGSGISAAIVQDDGDYGAVIVSGANLRLDPAQAAAAWERLGGARTLILQNEAPEAVNIAVAARARRDGAMVLLNAAPMREMSAALLSLVDVLIVNRVEASALAGHEVEDRDTALAALPKFSAPGRSVVVTLGGGGVVAQPSGAPARWIAAKPVRVVSTHGAGDCFVGALAAGLARGESLLSAAEAGNAAAAALVSG